jgi:hypothetical protein
MDITNLNFKQSVSGINFVYENDRYMAIGYYLSPQYNDKSEYIYNSVAPSEKKYKKIISIMFEPGYYLTNIITEDNKNGKITIVFQTENYLNKNMPITYEHNINSKTYTIQNADFTYNPHGVNNIKIKNGKAVIGCYTKKYESYVRGIDNAYIYLFILVIIMSSVYFNRSDDTASVSGVEIQLSQNTQPYKKIEF